MSFAWIPLILDNKNSCALILEGAVFSCRKKILAKIHDLNIISIGGRQTHLAKQRKVATIAPPLSCSF